MECKASTGTARQHFAWTFTFHLDVGAWTLVQGCLGPKHPKVGSPLTCRVYRFSYATLNHPCLVRHKYRARAIEGETPGQDKAVVEGRGVAATVLGYSVDLEFPVADER